MDNKPVNSKDTVYRPGADSISRRAIIRQSDFMICYHDVALFSALYYQKEAEMVLFYLYFMKLFFYCENIAFIGALHRVDRLLQR